MNSSGVERCVVFSDEFKFTLNNVSGMMRLCREKSEANNSDYFPPIFINSVSAMFWGCVGSNGVGRLVLCVRSVNEPYYCEIIQNNVMQCTESMLKCL